MLAMLYIKKIQKAINVRQMTQALKYYLAVFITKNTSFKLTLKNSELFCENFTKASS